jgi:methionine synthase II (cobalamin-independent)
MTKEEVRVVESQMVTLRDYIESRLESISEATRLQNGSTEIKIHEIEKDIKKIDEYINQLKGKADAKSVLVAQLIAVSGLVLGLVGLVITIIK